MNIQTKNRKGFTIIEVVLVLAIAALIMLMVFIALPALQRSQRDTQRKDDVSRLQAAITSYKSNERGQVPFKNGIVSEESSNFIDQYIIIGDTSAFADPQGPEYEFSATQSTDSDGQLNAGDGKILVLPGLSCADAVPASTTGLNPSNRGGALRIALESGGSHCIEY